MRKFKNVMADLLVVAISGSMIYLIAMFTMQIFIWK
jgi:hypothetical protein